MIFKQFLKFFTTTKTKITQKQTNLTSEYIATISAIGFTCGYYQIPVIDLYSGEAEFSENSIFSSFVRMSPPQFQQANVWIDIIRTCEWRVVNVLNAQDTQGRMFASRFHYLADQFEINVCLTSHIEISYTSLY